ncbi:MAG: hypothetical protein GY944_04505 [bacterium]|nr:hypothetical protein [bacterium]
MMKEKQKIDYRTSREGHRAEFSVYPQTVSHELLEGGWPKPDDQVHVGGEWQLLTRVPALLPIEDWLQAAVEALTANDVEQVEIIARRILRFDPEAVREESRLAHFLLGVLAQRTGAPEAGAHYRCAGGGPSIVRTAARTNLGVWQAMELEPIAAVESFRMALELEASFLPALLNLYRLASALAATNANPNPPDTSWQEIASETGKALSATSELDIDQLLNDSVLPNFRCLTVIPTQYPRFGATLRDPDHARPAADFLVDAAHFALQLGEAEEAQVLASEASQMSLGVRPAAASIANRGKIRQVEEHANEHARYVAEFVRRFYSNLRGGEFEVSQDQLAKAASVLDEETLRVMTADLVHAQASVAMQRLTAEGDTSDTHEWGAIGKPDVSRRLTTLPYWERFESLVAAGELKKARDLLRVTDPIDPDARKHAQDKLDRVTATVIAEARARIREQLLENPDAAEQSLSDLRTKVGRNSALVAIERDVQVARHRRAGEVAFEANEFDDAVEALRRACALVPSDRESLILLLTAELETSDLEERLRFDLRELGTEILHQSGLQERRAFASNLLQHQPDSYLARILEDSATEPQTPAPTATDKEN